MYGYSEDNLKALHKITDEVFVVSNKPQLSLIQKMKQIPCDIMATGIHKVPMDYLTMSQKSFNIRLCVSK